MAPRQRAGSAREAVVVVTGDVTMDWNLACTRGSEGVEPDWHSDAHTRACWQRGGAALLADLLEALAERLRGAGGPRYRILQPATPRTPDQVWPGDPRYHHFYSNWSVFRYSVKSPQDGEKPAWRVAEVLGLDPSPVGAPADDSDWRYVVDDTAEAALVALDDADLGFRGQRQLWPRGIGGEGCRPWILLKMARPVAQGPLWEQLHGNCSDHLVVVTTIDALRLTEVQVSRGLSWERTAQDLAWELTYNPRVNALSHCAHVVVSFGTAGAMLLSRPKPVAGPDAAEGTPRFRLFFDPEAIEETWAQAFPGHMIGYTTCLAAGLARQLLLSPEQPEIGQGIQGGLAAIRKLHREGYGQRSSIAPEHPVVFPIAAIADALGEDEAPFAVAEVRDPGGFLKQQATGADRTTAPGDGDLPSPGYWAILQDRYVGTLGQVAQEVALKGPEAALRGVPLGRFGALLSVDRQEIESLRSIGALIGEYCRQERPRRPLSIAVFGAPGAGKSFGVTEVARSLLPGQIKRLDFNLSQFDGPGQLLDALHLVRDVVLSGLVPLVFWDEFDTAADGQPLGWLRHFLAPMQDGAFQEGQISHPIGRAIFVFAGGTSESMQAFDRGRDDTAFRMAKGPDFVSRLKGYVDILGPNPRPRGQVADLHCIIRRAIVLRSILQRDAPQIFPQGGGRGMPNIDPGVLRAFLEIPEYKHGARSMESLVAMSMLAGKGRFERSSLPAEEQLALHADGRSFLALVQMIDLEGELLEKLAEAAHEVYREGLAAAGRELPMLQMSYAELPEYQQEQNRNLVRDIPRKLARIGYIMRPARSSERPFSFPGAQLELLAEMEHALWLQARIEAGWRYAPENDADAKVHRAMLPWHSLSAEEMTRRYSPTDLAAIGTEELPEDEKDKDRDLARGIPAILARAGYTIERA